MFTLHSALHGQLVTVSPPSPTQQPHRGALAASFVMLSVLREHCGSRLTCELGHGKTIGKTCKGQGA